MGCTSSITRPEIISKQIDIQISKDRQLARNELKLLLLGAGESGKSTVVKQMKILYGSGYSTMERMQFRPIVVSNAIESMFGIIKAMEALNVRIFHPSHSKYIKDFKEMMKSYKEFGMTYEIGHVMTILWNDSAVQSCFADSIQYQLSDSTSYFLNDLTRITHPDYVPSELDILKTRVRTTGINETTFYCKAMLFRVVDVGGQRSQRKKWLHCFEDVSGVIFCSSLSEYDMVLEEDCQVNRMVESMALFEMIGQNRWLAAKQLILFLNKTDLLKKKIDCSPLTTCFPEYDGPNTYDGAVEYIKKSFLKLRNKEDSYVFVHFTCAVDKESIRWAFDLVSDIVISHTKRECGIF